jgi:hypothetical protein
MAMSENPMPGVARSFLRCYSYRDDLAPPGQRGRFVGEGRVQGRGWIQPPGIGQPDRVLHMRGDATRLSAQPRIGTTFTGLPSD